MKQCSFNKGWLGKCKNQTEGEMCEEHSGLKCVSCGSAATRQCTETMQFVCGELLCDDCAHETAEDGTSGRSNKHCKKCDQKYLPWYMREAF